jgi:hypothetical protein
MNFWNVFFGVFSGIIAGVFINLIINWIREYSYKKKIKRNLKFEFDFNIKKIDSFLEELNKYQNMTNADNLNNYFGFFNLSKIISITLIQSFNQGLIYKFFNHEDIAFLQNFLSDFSLGTEKYMNDKIEWTKKNHSLQEIKKLVNDDITFWEKKFNENRKMIEEIRFNFLTFFSLLKSTNVNF